MASTPNYAATPVIGMAQISTANTNRDGTGTIATVVAGASGGRRVSRLVAQATGTTTAGMIRFYLYDGTNTRMYREIVVSAATPSATVPAFRGEVALPPDFALPSAMWEIRASTEKGEVFNIFAHGDDP
jgi:hypothetical protein